MNYISRYKMVKEIYFYFKAPIKKKEQNFLTELEPSSYF